MSDVDDRRRLVSNKFPSATLAHPNREMAVVDVHDRADVDIPTRCAYSPTDKPSSRTIKRSASTLRARSVPFRSRRASGLPPPQPLAVPTSLTQAAAQRTDGHIGYNLLAPAGVQALPLRQTSGGHAREALERG
jgi:hypothetical protein